MAIAGVTSWNARALSGKPVRFGAQAPGFSAAAPVLPLPATIQPDLFAPQSLTPAMKRFAVVGDAGTGLKPQLDVAQQMEKAFQSRPFASVLVLGDNVYEDGEPERFEAAIRKPYQNLLDAGVRFYPVMGNHDVRKGFGLHQQAYWGVPTFYNQRLGNVEIFAIDTTLFIPRYDNSHARNPFLAHKQAEIQMTWLEKALTDSTAKYKIVLGHYPLYSSGMHGTKADFTLVLRNILEPVFARHGVDMYLAGHEHHYEKSFPIQGVHHFVSGAGGKLRPEIFYQDNPPYPRDRAVNRRHFMLFEETPWGLRYDAIARDGALVDSGLVPDKQRVPGQPTRLI